MPENEPSHPFTLEPNKKAALKLERATTGRHTKPDQGKFGDRCPKCGGLVKRTFTIKNVPISHQHDMLVNYYTAIDVVAGNLKQISAQTPCRGI